MNKISARFTAGHFFRKMNQVLIAVTIISGCGEDRETAAAPVETVASFGSPAVLIEFTGAARMEFMPETLSGMDRTSWGRFHTLDEEPADPFRRVFEMADSTGLLVLAVIPEDFDYPATRDHLIIRTGSDGIPVRTEPEMESAFMADSVWRDPLIRQQTILELMEFFKPDIVFIRAGTPSDVQGIADYWSSAGITAAFYSAPDWNEYRGWGAFTGTGIQQGVIQGMTVDGFLATVILISGLEWTDSGYPAMQAISTRENR